MITSTEQITASAQKLIDTSATMLNLSLAGWEQVIQLHINASRQICAQNLCQLKHLAGISDPQEIFTQINELVNQNLEKNLAVTGEAYTMVNKVQVELNQLAKEQWSTF
jgi:phasin family protein